MNPTDSSDRCEIDLTLRYPDTSYIQQMNNMLENLVAKFGEQNRWLIKDSLLRTIADKMDELKAMELKEEVKGTI